MTTPTIYLTCRPGGLSSEDVTGFALAEDGTSLCAHISNSSQWSRSDMEMWNRNIYAAHYPDGYQLVWIDDPAGDERWQVALALNRAKAAPAVEAQHG